MKRSTRAKIYLLTVLLVGAGLFLMDPLGVLSYIGIAFALIVTAVLMSVALYQRGDGGGLCLCCGYDLRASRARCPECGRLIPPGTPTHRDL